MIIMYEHEQQEQKDSLKAIMIDTEKKIISVQRVKMVNGKIVGAVTVKYCL